MHGQLLDSAADAMHRFMMLEWLTIIVIAVPPLILLVVVIVGWLRDLHGRGRVGHPPEHLADR